MLAPGQAEGLARTAGERDIEPFQQTGHVAFRAAAVVGDAFEEVEDHVGLVLAQAGEQGGRVTADAPAGNLEARFLQVLAHGFDGGKHLVLRFRVRMISRQQRLVVQHDDARLRHARLLYSPHRLNASLTIVDTSRS